MRKPQLKESVGMGGAYRILAPPADQIGVWTSALCVIHCLLTPVLLSISAVSAHFLPSEERTHRTTCGRDRRNWSIALLRGAPETPIATCFPADGYRSGLHFRRRLVRRSPPVTRGRGFRHSDWQRIHDLRSQNESHILSRLQLQPFRVDVCQPSQARYLTDLPGTSPFSAGSDPIIMPREHST